MDSKSKSEEGGRPLTFPELLYDMIEEETQENPNGIIRWTEEGDGFVIENKQPEINTLLKKYFSHGKYTSLTRQLLHYDIKRVPDGWTYNHPLFRRGHKEDLLNIKRKGKNNKKRGRPQPSREEQPRRKSTRRSSDASRGSSLVKSTGVDQDEYDGSDISTTKETSTFGGDGNDDDAETEADNNDAAGTALKLDFKAEMPKQPKSTNKIILPFALKKVMIQTWENISLRNLIPNLPAPISVRKLLELYVDAKLEYHASKSFLFAVQDIEKKKRGWKDLTEGVALFFDKALPSRLLYEHEIPHFRAMQSAGETRRWSDVYGCEHLLRLLLRLPDILSECVDDVTRKRILQDMTEFVRFLHQHKDTLCVTPFRALTTAELEEIEKKAEEPM